MVNYKLLKKITKNKTGMTFIELIVAIPIFVIFVIIMVNMILSLVKLNKRQRDIRELIDQATIITLTMRRELNTTKITTDGACHLTAPANDRGYSGSGPPGEGEIQFVAQDDTCNGFVTSNAEAIPPNALHLIRDKFGANTDTLLTSEFVKVTKLDFYVYDNIPSDQHPLVFIVLEIEHKINLEIPHYTFQFAASPASN